MATKTSVQKFFRENADRLDPSRDPTNFNINNGLYALVDLIDGHHRDLERKIQHLSAQVQSLENQLRRLR